MLNSKNQNTDSYKNFHFKFQRVKRIIYSFYAVGEAVNICCLFFINQNFITMKTIIFTIAVLFFSIEISYSQNIQWTNYLSTTNLFKPGNTTMDNSGNVYVTGTGGTSGISVPRFWKLNSSGVAVYTLSFLGPFYTTPNHKGTTVNSSLNDNLGNLYLAGATDSANFNSKGYISKWGPNGDSLWKRYAGINDTLGYVEWHSIKFDNQGNLIAGGLNYGLGATPGNWFFIIAKYNTNGDVIFIRRYRPVQYDEIVPTDINIMSDNSGNIFLASTIKTTMSNYNFALARFSSSGNPLGVSYYDNGGSDFLTSSVIDNSGNIYLFGTSANMSGMQDGVACVKFNNSGVQQWVFRTGTLFTRASRMTTGVNNDVYITAKISTDAPFFDYGVLIKINATTGAEVFRKTMDAPSISDKMSAVAVSMAGTVYCTGVFGDGSANNTIQTRAYTINGDSLWSVNSNSNIDQSLNPVIVVTGAGNSILVSGSNAVSTNNIQALVIKFSTLTSVGGVSEIAEGFNLSQNYPNPFNPETEIKFSINQSGFVKMAVYNLLGKEIATLVKDNLKSGEYSVKFNGQGLNSGIYYYVLESNGNRETKKMMLVK
ncbi:MAG TPA: hypothetical protein DEP28_05990 [Bacteroidetes bacterium]|nr:hypothetical protein [Bacteroidota bacterium]HCN38190.1 hypothetical protein [Bacteroidota bacterium]